MLNMANVEEKLAVALVGVLNSPTRPRGLAFVKYPTRELRIKSLSNGDVEVTLSKYGFEYKHRGSKPKIPPSVDLEYTAAIITRAIAPGFSLISIEDIGRAIKIIVRRDDLAC